LGPTWRVLRVAVDVVDTDTLLPLAEGTSVSPEIMELMVPEVVERKGASIRCAFVGVGMGAPSMVTCGWAELYGA